MILNVAHEEAKKLLAGDPEFVEERHRGLKLHMREIGETRRAWTQIS